MSEYRGSYIVIEGSDPEIRAEQAERLAREQSGVVAHEHDEGEEYYRSINRLQSLGSAALVRADFLRTTANRLETYEKTIEPTLHQGNLVVANGNWLSSAAEHGIMTAHAGMGAAAVRNATREQLPPEYMQPAFTAMLYTPFDKREAPKDIYRPNPKFPLPDETMRARREAAYDELIGEIPAPFQYIDQSGSPEEVEARIAEALKNRRIL